MHAKNGARAYLQKLNRGSRNVVKTAEYQIDYGVQNPYVNQLRAQYDSSLGAASDWWDIGKSVAGNVSKGIGNRIGGHAKVAPASVTFVQGRGGGASDGGGKSLPPWVPFAAAGVGVLALAMILKKGR